LHPMVTRPAQHALSGERGEIIVFLRRLR
jgi:hypothetical protein